MGGVEVLVNGRSAPLLFTSASKVNFRCPQLAPGTPLQITLQTENGAALASDPSYMAVAAPGLFRMGDTKQGGILISETSEIAMEATDGIPSRPAHQGEYLTIYASGLGQVENYSGAEGPAPSDRPIRLVNNVRAYVGGIEIDPVFAGLAPGTVGLFQVNVQIPQGCQPGSAVPFYLEVVLPDGTALRSNSVTMAIDRTQ